MMLFVFGWVAFGFALGGLAMWRANRKAGALTAKRRWTKFGVYVAIVYGVMFCAMVGTRCFFALAVVIAALGGGEIARAFRFQWRAAWLAFSVYLSIAAGFLLFAVQTPSNVVLFVYVIVAVFDGFSQAIGQLLGRHQLAPRISPNKTIEGMIGGFCCAMLLAVALRELPSYSAMQAILRGAELSAAGLCGDLLASWCKRRAGVKDFSHLLPEHGGILDRFDSLLAAGCAFWLL